MTDTMRNTVYFAGVALLIVITGFVQSWNSALFILNFGLISAIMAWGVNLQWGFAGLFNVGIMGFVALGGLATVLVSMPCSWRNCPSEALDRCTVALTACVVEALP